MNTEVANLFRRFVQVHCQRLQSFFQPEVLNLIPKSKALVMTSLLRILPLPFAVTLSRFLMV